MPPLLDNSFLPTAEISNDLFFSHLVIYRSFHFLLPLLQVCFFCKYNSSEVQPQISIIGDRFFSYLPFKFTFLLPFSQVPPPLEVSPGATRPLRPLRYATDSKSRETGPCSLGPGPVSYSSFIVQILYLKTNMWN